MRITRLDMDNFGPFNGKQVDGFSPGLTVVRGENEAGKSALRAFMRVVLFGFPRRRTEDHDDYYYEPTLPGGAAGSVHVADSSGDPYTIHREEGVRGGPVTVSGTRDGGEDLLRELTGGVDDAFYQNVFSISLSELQSFESLGRGEITERIYSAGLRVCKAGRYMWIGGVSGSDDLADGGGLERDQRVAAARPARIPA